MSRTPPSPHALRVADLPQNRPTPFTLEPDAEQTAEIRTALGLSDLRKVRFTGEIRADGRKDWALEGQLGATVVQPCVATLAPVTTRIEAPVTRRFVADYAEPEDPEAEMPDDDTAEPLTPWIDLQAVLTEALSLALPVYPRADGADPVMVQVTEPGKQAMTDDDVKPFAGLAALRDKLPGGQDD